MDEFCEIRTVFGKKKIKRNTITLSHEHICCYSEYLNMMSERYLSKTELVRKSADVLKIMKKNYKLGLFIDCTVPNIGRDIEILKEVSEMSEVDIVCSSGFYYNDEPIINCMSCETIADFIAEDAEAVCAGVIKAAVEYDVVSDFNIKLLKASAIAQKKTGLPIILHTNANNKNGLKAVEILRNENAELGKIVVGHLSDTDNTEYIIKFAEMGCYVALDRMYDNRNDEYINAKVNQIREICNAGYANRVLISHDAAVFMGFGEHPEIKNPRWKFMFDYIIPKLDLTTAKKILEENPISMLCGR